LVRPPRETLSELEKRSDFAEAKIALSIFSKPFPPTAEAVNSKKMSRVFCQILSPKNSFGKTESAFRPATLPEYLEGRTPKEKHPFLFQKKFHPRQIRNARSVFLSGLPRLCEAVAERFILAQKKFEQMI
jgi:hypothetical protein